MPILRTLGALFSVSVLAACSTNYKTPDDTIVTVIGSPVQSLDPLFSTDANSQHLNQLIHVALTQIGDDLVPKPQLAEKFKIISDKVIEFTLRKGCQFQNDREIKSDDVEKSLALFINPDNKSPFQSALGKISKFEKIDDYTFRLHTKDVTPNLLYDLGLLKIIPVETYDAVKFQTNPVGGGPYRVTLNDPSGVKLSRFNTKCLPLPPMPQINAKVVRDDLSRYLKLKNGEIDIVFNEMDMRKVKQILDGKAPNVSGQVADGTTYSYMGLNFKNPHLAKKNVRKAIALALDLPSIIEYKLVGMAQATNTVLSKNNWYRNPKIQPITRNLNEAKRLLDSEGYFNGENNKPPLQLTLKTTTFKPIMENARAIAEQLKEVGIKVDHKAFEWGTFYGDVKARSTEMFLLRWVGLASPDILSEIFHSDQLALNNRTNYVNKDVDKFLDLARSTLDPQKRLDAYSKVQELVADDLPYISLWHNMNAAVYRTSLQNVVLSPPGDWDIFLKMYKKKMD